MKEEIKLHCCNCGELIDAHVKFCPNCGFDFEDDNESSVNPKSTFPVEIRLNAIQFLAILCCIISICGALIFYFTLQENGIDCFSISVMMIASALISSITLYGFGSMLNNTEIITKQLEKSNTLLEKLASNEQKNK